MDHNLHAEILLLNDIKILSYVPRLCYTKEGCKQMIEGG